jgi:hypothetical protein
MKMKKSLPLRTLRKNKSKLDRVTSASSASSAVSAFEPEMAANAI